MKTITLYKSVGEKEFSQIVQNNFRSFSILTDDNNLIMYDLFDRARELAEKFHTQDEKSNFIGFVLEVDIEENFFSEYISENKSKIQKNQLVITDETLELFNSVILDKIRVVDVFVGENFKKLENKFVDGDLYMEMDFHNLRLKLFLATTDRKIIPHNFFDKLVEDNEIVEKDIKKEIEEINRLYELKKEKTKTLNSIEEAVDYLIHTEFTEEQLDDIKKTTPLARINNSDEHFGKNLYYRNLFFHSNDNLKFKESVRNYSGREYCGYGELGEGHIADLLWRRLNNCEIEKLSQLDEIRKNEIEIRKNEIEIEAFTNDFYSKNGKIRGEIEYFDEQNDLFFENFSKSYDEKGFHLLWERNRLLSYNFSNAEIIRYFELKKKLQESDVNQEKIMNEEKAILAKLEPENYDTFEKLSENSIKINNVYSKFIKQIDNSNDENESDNM